MFTFAGFLWKHPYTTSLAQLAAKGKFYLYNSYEIVSNSTAFLGIM